MQVLQNNDLKRVQESIDLEECCAETGEQLVAYNSRTDKLLCNKCVYNSNPDDAGNLQFTAYVASELKQLFDEKFANYMQSDASLGSIAPHSIYKSLDHTISELFSRIEQMTNFAKAQVLTKINDSKNLKDIEALLAQEKPNFLVQHESQFEGCKQDFERKVHAGLFSQVVERKDNYELMIQKMAEANRSMQKVIEEGRGKIQKIIKIRPVQELGQKIGEIVDSAVEIDNSAIRGMTNPAEFDRQRQLDLQRQQMEEMRKQQLEAQRMREEELRQQQLAQQVS